MLGQAGESITSGYVCFHQTRAYLDATTKDGSGEGGWRLGCLSVEPPAIERTCPAHLTKDDGQVCLQVSSQIPG